MNNLWFLPAGRVLANSGEGRNGSLFNCFTLPISDSRASIYKALMRAANMFAHGGGVGFNFSELREEGAPVAHGSFASGPVSFMKLFDVSASVISQSSRRGAQLGILSCDHIDIEKFIRAKENGGYTHFNLSVGITDEFMESIVKGDEEFYLKSRYDESYVTVDPMNLFNLIAKQAWLTGDPGVVFLDSLNKDNAAPHLGEIKCVNVCGEMPLLFSENCCLGSINLTKMLTNGRPDLEKLVYTTSTAIRFLDAVHDVNVSIAPFLKRASDRTRKVGLGVMGWADMLAILGIPYDSPEAINLAKEIGKTMKRSAYETSVLLAEQKGPYQAFDENKSQNIWYRNDPVTPTRNANLLSIAPTGSISLLANVNSGIEPFFALAYTRKVTEGELTTQYTISEVNPYLEGLTEEQEKVLLKTGSIQSLDLPNREVFKTAHEIKPTAHAMMQAAWQENIDAAVSKTLNLPNDATPDDIKKLLVFCWALGLKGITVFRDGCRDLQILNVGVS